MGAAEAATPGGAAAPTPPHDRFPVRSVEYAATLGGERARLWVSAYANRLMVVASGEGAGTLGAMVAAQREAPLGGGAAPPPGGGDAGGGTYRVDTLLGPRPAGASLPELAARRLAERLDAAGCALPLLLCWGLRTAAGGAGAAAGGAGAGAADAALVRELADAVLAHPVW
jgi:hypothetical protein